MLSFKKRWWLVVFRFCLSPCSKLSLCFTCLSLENTSTRFTMPKRNEELTTDARGGHISQKGAKAPEPSRRRPEAGLYH
uniref:Putative secreted protein n=1 Tax=Anopheles triannulatus TaxID=58253 RepID=A0A2M4B4N1_9DIPT